VTSAPFAADWVGGPAGRAGLELHVYAVPLVTPFRGLDVREGVLVRGPAGWGEFAPFREYDDTEAVRWWAAAREAATTGWPRPVRDRVPVNATVPAVPADQVASVLDRFPGCTTAKVKVAAGAPGSVPADLDRLAAVRDALGPGGRIRIDVNGGWDLAAAVRLLPAYAGAAGGLEYAEQPCARTEDLAALRRCVDVPVAADESIRRAEDPLRVARLGAADVAVLKVAPLGGVAAGLRIARQLAEHGIPAVVSSALETGVGIAAGLALAAALPELPYACGLATGALLAGDVLAPPLRVQDGTLPALPTATADPQRVADVAAPPDVAGWWHARAKRVAALAAARPA
jgi:O-succinylbenzoate synthase